MFFSDIATSERHRALNNIYIKHNLFDQIELEWNVEVQKKQFVPFKSPRDVMQINTLSTQLGRRWDLVEWYWDATYVPFSHFWLTCRHEQTSDYLSAGTLEPLLQNIIFPTKWNYQSPCPMKKKIFLFWKCSNHFPANIKNPFLASSKKIHFHFFTECIVNLLRGKLRSMKRHLVAFF